MKLKLNFNDNETITSSTRATVGGNPALIAISTSSRLFVIDLNSGELLSEMLINYCCTLVRSFEGMPDTIFLAIALDGKFYL